MKDPLRPSSLLVLLLGLNQCPSVGLASIDLSSLGPPVAEMQSRDNLGQDSPDSLLFDVLLVAQAAFDDLLKIPSFAVLHHYVELQVALVDAAVDILHDVGVLQVAQDVYLCNDLLLFLVIHLAVV